MYLKLIFLSLFITLNVHSQNCLKLKSRKARKACRIEKKAGKGKSGFFRSNKKKDSSEESAQECITRVKSDNLNFPSVREKLSEYKKCRTNNKLSLTKAGAVTAAVVGTGLIADDRIKRNNVAKDKGFTRSGGKSAYQNYLDSEMNKAGRKNENDTKIAHRNRAKKEAKRVKKGFKGIFRGWSLKGKKSNSTKSYKKDNSRSYKELYKLKISSGFNAISNSVNGIKYGSSLNSGATVSLKDCVDLDNGEASCKLNDAQLKLIQISSGKQTICKNRVSFKEVFTSTIDIKIDEFKNSPRHIKRQFRNGILDNIIIERDKINDSAKKKLGQIGPSNCGSKSSPNFSSDKKSTKLSRKEKQVKQVKDLVDWINSNKGKLTRTYTGNICRGKNKLKLKLEKYQYKSCSVIKGKTREIKCFVKGILSARNKSGKVVKENLNFDRSITVPAGNRKAIEKKTKGPMSAEELEASKLILSSALGTNDLCSIRNFASSSVAKNKKSTLKSEIKDSNPKKISSKVESSKVIFKNRRIFKLTPIDNNLSVKSTTNYNCTRGSGDFLRCNIPELIVKRGKEKVCSLKRINFTYLSSMYSRSKVMEHERVTYSGGVLAEVKKAILKRIKNDQSCNTKKVTSAPSNQFNPNNRFLKVNLNSFTYRGKNFYLSGTYKSKQCKKSSNTYDCEASGITVTVKLSGKQFGNRVKSTSYKRYTKLSKKELESRGERNANKVEQNFLKSMAISEIERCLRAGECKI